MPSTNHTAAGLALAFLAVLTLADGVNNNALSLLLGRADSQPGLWNRGTTNLILGGVSDLIGQLVIGYLADRRGRQYAMNVNASSLLASSVITLLSLFTHQKWTALATVAAPLGRVFGGSAHTSAFLALVLLHNPQDTSVRSAYYYATGATIVLAQSFASFLAPLLTKRSNFLPFAIATVSCLLAYGLAASYHYVSSDSDSENDGPDTSVTEPLLPRQETEPSLGSGRQDVVSRTVAPVGRWLDDYTGRVFSAGSKSLSIVAAVFFLMAVSKATRPLFTSYIQHRDGATPEQAQSLWLMRTIMSVAIFSVILPLSVLRLPLRDSARPNFTLNAGRISIILMGLGAFLIGVSGSIPAITTALVINTLGVATDLSILAFAANFIPQDVSGRTIMLISSFESAGTLLGIGILYPIYQWSLQDVSFFAGGVPYYICAGIYAVVASVIWTLVPVA